MHILCIFDTEYIGSASEILGVLISIFIVSIIIANCAYHSLIDAILE